MRLPRLFDRRRTNSGRIQTRWLDLNYGEVPFRDKTMRFAPTGSSSKKGLRTLFSKEPITLAWIDTFADGETLYDIGANVGMYTIGGLTTFSTRMAYGQMFEGAFESYIPGEAIDLVVSVRTNGRNTLEFE